MMDLIKNKGQNQIENRIREDFTQIPNALIQDRTLSVKARFVYSWMSSKKPGWTFYMKNMVAEIGLSEEVVRKSLKELIDQGWIERKGQILDNNKFSGVCYVIHYRRKKK